MTLAIAVVCGISLMTAPVKAEPVYYETEDGCVVYEGEETVVMEQPADDLHGRAGTQGKLEAPSNLRIDTSGYVTSIVWDRVAGVSKYNVEFYYEGNNTYRGSILSSNSYSLHDLENKSSGEYTIKVQAVASDTSLNSEWSSLVYQYNKPNAKLNTPTNIRWDENKFGTIIWDSVEGASGYQIIVYYNGKYVGSSSGRFSSCQYDLSSYMGNEGEYKVKIAALSGDINTVSSSGEGSSSNLTFENSEQKLTVPANIRWEGIVLKWDAVENASGYEIEMYLNGQYFGQSNRNDTSCKMDYIFENHGNGTYTFRIRALSNDISKYANSDYASAPDYVVGEQTPEYPEEQVRNFVKRLYQVILNREAEEDGLNAWTKKLLAGKATGAQIVAGFVESDEFTQRELSNEEVVEIMYQAMLGRASDEGGKAGWSKILNNGCSYLNIVNGFSGSVEFNEICGNYGITAGTVELNRQRDKNPQLTAFVARCYTQALDRQYEIDGLEAWCDAIISGRNTPKQVAQNFIFSDEFTQKNLNEEQFVKVLYRTFMGREAEASGLAAWVNVLESGKEDRAKVLEGFSDSAEFDGILQSFGLLSGENNNEAPVDPIKPTVAKPSKITIVCDGTVITEENGGADFYNQLSKELGIQLEFERPNHMYYKDYCAELFASGQADLPDVVLLSAKDYATYASLGYLWDMTDAWEKSEVKNSGRLSRTAVDLVENSKVIGPDGEYHLYGFSAVQGNGCVTYVKQSWLDAAGIKELPKTYAEYYDMLVKMKKTKNAEFVVTANGLIGGETPYINYLPEFYQDAYPEFYEKNGKWIDGFTEQAMKNALQRMADAYAAGIIDPEIINRSGKDCRTLFEEDKFGVFTYWAGQWCGTLTDNIRTKNLYQGADREVLVCLPPIAEVGQYLNRISPQWCITTSCQNPEGVFEYYLQKMLDGGRTQLLWEYGAEGTHWSYEDNKFKLKPTASYPYNHIDGLLKLGEYAADFNGGVDIGLLTVSTETKMSAQKIFNENNRMAPRIKKTDKYNDYIATIQTVRKTVIVDVAMGKLTVEEGMEKYQRECGDMVNEVLKSLN